ncbi:MAG: extracellular solute-binding protein [Acidocella sp.]|nr:extracellular solute-binding protein [Acidocella sp.]
MQMSRRALLAAASALTATGLPRAWAGAGADGKFTVAFAGSMGVVMDEGVGPAFQAKSGAQYQGIGQAAMALAHLLSAKTMMADVFIPVSPAPMKAVEEAGLVDEGQGIPVASTQIVLAYSPASKFAAAIAKAGTKAGAKSGGAAWTKILQEPGFRFGRTDPTTDPQGQYVLYTLQLAEMLYKMPGLAKTIAGPDVNEAQIFTEPSLLSRLQEGQIDATLGYQSAVVSQKLPFIALPSEINFSDPSKNKDWYSKASLTLTSKGTSKTLHPGLLVFYAAALKNATNPTAAQGFVDFLASQTGQAIFAEYGYGPARGPKI